MQKLSLVAMLVLAVACRGGEEKRGAAEAPMGAGSGSAVGGEAAVAAPSGEGAAASGSGAASGSAAAGHDHAAHDGHDHAEPAEEPGGAPEVEKIPTAKVVELASASVRKMEELSKAAAAAKGDCPKLAVALDGFYRDNAAFIAEMNGLDDKMTKLQRRIADEQFTSPMQKAMSSLLTELMSCKDDPAVAKAFLQLQK